MSNTLVPAPLKGYAQVPEIPHTLNYAYNLNVSCFGSDLEEIGIKASTPTRRFAVRKRVTTHDGYTWFWSLSFYVPFGTVTVLFPWCQDWGEKDSMQLDRSIAIYKKGFVLQRTIKRLCLGLQCGLERHHRNKRLTTPPR